MIQSDLLHLRKYIVDGFRLTSRETARRIWKLESLGQRCCARIDFSGVASGDISQEFIAELFHLEDPSFQGVWLSPVNYSASLAHLLGACLCQLEKRRRSSMRDGLIRAGLHFEPVRQSGCPS